MQRRSRIDAAGALHHIMVRGIEGGWCSETIRAGINFSNDWEKSFRKRRRSAAHGR